LTIEGLGPPRGRLRGRPSPEEGNMANGKVQFKINTDVKNTKNCHKLEIPKESLGKDVRWKQVLYLPGQKRGKSLRKFKRATITIVLE